MALPFLEEIRKASLPAHERDLNDRLFDFGG
jgi:hypothetical protein